MKIVQNAGSDRVVDLVRPRLSTGSRLDVVSSSLSVFAFDELRKELSRLEQLRLVLPSPESELSIIGSDADRAARNRLQTRWLAGQLAAVIRQKAEIRRARGAVPQGAFVLRDPTGTPEQAILGSLSFSTDGLGLAPGNPLNLIQASEAPDEAALLSQWFDAQWAAIPPSTEAKDGVLETLDALASHKDPFLVYAFRLDDFKRNPQQFIELAAEAINRCKRLAIVDGIRYQRLGDDAYYAQELFEQEELTGYLKNLLPAQKAAYEQVVYDSDTEAAFADQLEKNTAIKVYAKLPGWFTVPTPLGAYNPDWAVLVQHDDGERLYFVVETKSGLFADDLRDKEAAKIECGKAHFKALAVGENPARYTVAKATNDLLTEES